MMENADFADVLLRVVRAIEKSSKFATSELY